MLMPSHDYQASRCRILSKHSEEWFTCLLEVELDNNILLSIYFHENTVLKIIILFQQLVNNGKGPTANLPSKDRHLKSGNGASTLDKKEILVPFMFTIYIIEYEFKSFITIQ